MKNNNKNNIRNNSQKEIRKNIIRNKYIPSDGRKAISAEKNIERNNKNILRRNKEEEKKNVYKITNLKTFKSEYDLIICYYPNSTSNSFKIINI